MIPARGRPDTGDPLDQRLGHTGAMTTQIGGGPCQSAWRSL